MSDTTHRGWNITPATIGFDIQHPDFDRENELDWRHGHADTVEGARVEIDRLLAEDAEWTEAANILKEATPKPPAGADAIPEYAPDDISHLEGLASYLDGYARDKGRAGLPASKSLFEEIAKRLREYDAMRTPKPPAGGDAGAVGWQPIESAPRDGTWFIADGGGLDRPTPMKWCARVGAWEADAVMLEDWDDQAEGYSRPLFWWAIPERHRATPKPPAGGEAGDNLRRIYDALPKGPRCRDCGDEDGRCPSLNRPCDPTDWAIELIQSALALPAPVVEGDVLEALRSARPVSSDQTISLLHGLLAHYEGQPNQAGEAFKILDAALSEGRSHG